MYKVVFLGGGGAVFSSLTGALKKFSVLSGINYTLPINVEQFFTVNRLYSVNTQVIPI